jgi:two-component system, chemotaxis family, protein-glutamate methylesterase/glutaminase
LKAQREQTDAAETEDMPGRTGMLRKDFLSILVVDDTAIYRKILSNIVKSIPAISRVDTAPTGGIALKKLNLNRYDLVFLDMVMPEMDGNETLRRIKKEFPDTAVAMVSAASEKGSEAAIDALNLGALDLIRKPQGKNVEESTQILKAELSNIVDIVHARRKVHAPARGGSHGGGVRTPTRPSVRPVRKAGAPKGRRPLFYNVLAIGSSTGGPEALSRVLPKLPARFKLPIVIVQHMPPVFTAALAKDLNSKSQINVKEAREGDALLPGTALIAPGGIHMIVKHGPNGPVVAMDDGPPENSCKPAVDVLFKSVAECFDTKGVLSVVLTGMGSDGAEGVRVLKDYSCYCLTQSKSSCVVYGMPLAVDSAGLSDESIELDEMASRIAHLVSGRGGIR